MMVVLREEAGCREMTEISHMGKGRNATCPASAFSTMCNLCYKVFRNQNKTVDLSSLPFINLTAAAIHGGDLD